MLNRNRTPQGRETKKKKQQKKRMSNCSLSAPLLLHLSVVQQEAQKDEELQKIITTPVARSI